MTFLTAGEGGSMLEFDDWKGLRIFALNVISKGISRLVSKEKWSRFLAEHRSISNADPNELQIGDA